MMKKLFLALFVATLALPLAAHAKALLNLEFQIVDGRLLLPHSKGVRDDFNKDTKGNLSKANANWPALVEKKGK
jgi:hypothetical protein